MNFVDDYNEELQDNYFPKKEKKNIEIPDFLNSGEILPTEQQQINEAILNNTPANKEIEDKNHLNELEQVCQNWRPEEWQRVILHADSQLMLKEISRRTKLYEAYVKNERDNMELLTTQNV